MASSWIKMEISSRSSKTVLMMTILELEGYKTHSCEGDEYPITPCLARIISKVPELTEWIISSLLINGRNLIIRI